MKCCVSITLALIIILASVAMAEQMQSIDLVPYDLIPSPLDEQHHYLLLCTDVWEQTSDSLGNTDGILLITTDTSARRVMMTSLIRDALVQRPDGMICRVNTLSRHYSPEDVCQTLSQHLGIKIEYYFLFDLSQVEHIIDYVGGVELAITEEEAGYLTRYSIPADSTVPTVYGAGVYHMTGYAAVIYMRMRKIDGQNDFMRTQRVRNVLSALANQNRTISMRSARAALDFVMNNSTKTNLTLTDLLNTLGDVLLLRNCAIDELIIPQDGQYQTVRQMGMPAKEIDWPAVRIDLQSFLFSE